MILQCPKCRFLLVDVEDIAKTEYYYVGCWRFHVVMVVDPDMHYLRMAARKKWESEEDDHIFELH